jgi:hypothetical protein
VARRNFYKLFYLALLPMGLIALLLKWIPNELPLGVSVGVTLGVPVVLLVTFWNTLGEMELAEVFITTSKKGQS